MRVLWFANTCCNADEYFGKKLKGTGGWLKSLDVVLQEKVELFIAFYSQEQVEPFLYGKAHYYPIFRKRSVVRDFIDTITGSIIGREDVQLYLDIIREVRPDVIHVHGTENPFGFIAGLTEIPVAISIQGIVTAIYHKYLAGLESRFLHTSKFSVINPLGFFSRFSYSYRKFRQMMERERIILKDCSNIIGRTDWDYRVTRVLAPNSRYYSAGEILRSHFYDAVWKPKQKETWTIFTTSSNSFYKGFETICLAFNELKHINPNIEWRVAGIDRDDLITRIVTKKLKNNYPTKGVVLLGSLSEENLIKELMNADIYVMPSHIENSPNSLCEAMILGIPCIASYAGGTSSLLSDGEDGLLVQSGDPFFLAGSILHLLGNYDLAVEYGQKARVRATVRHDPNLIVADYLSAYSCMVE